MLPHHIITAAHILTIDVTHHLQRPTPRVVGASLFTGSVESGEVRFRLEATLLSPSTPITSLLTWLDDRIDQEATIAGHGLASAAALLARSSGNLMPSLTSALAGRGRQPTIELAADRAYPDGASLTAACQAASLPCSTPEKNDNFIAWITGCHTPLFHQLELDAIAVWRLAMTHIGARSALGQEVNAVIEEHLIDWLRAWNLPAGLIHLDHLLSTNG